MKVERESKKLSLREVSEATKIPERLLRAIEEDQYDLISSPVYVKGFLDAYARYLGLDPADIIRQYQENYENKTPLKSLGPKRGENFFRLDAKDYCLKEKDCSLAPYRWHFCNDFLDRDGDLLPHLA